MGERQQQIAVNQATCRTANERVRASDETDRRRRLDERVSFYCECGDPDCREHMHLTVPEYEAVRTDPTLFAVLPGHVLADAERVLEEHDSYLVVQKFEEVWDIVDRSDPRSTKDCVRDP